MGTGAGPQISAGSSPSGRVAAEHGGPDYSLATRRRLPIKAYARGGVARLVRSTTGATRKVPWSPPQSWRHLGDGARTLTVAGGRLRLDSTG